MKRMFRLIRYEFMEQGIILFALLSLMALLEFILFGSAVLGPAIPREPVRFERLVDSGSIPIIFALTLVCVTGLGVLRFLRSIMPTKSIYASLTLPVSRRVVYLAKLLSAFLDVLCLFSVQLVLILAFHYLFAGKFADTLTPGSLYLSFFRSNFLKTFFPPEPICALTILLSAFTVAACALGAAVGIKARMYWQPIYLVGMAVYSASRIFPLMLVDVGVGLMKLFLVLMLLTGCAWIGIEPFEKGEVGS